MDKFVRSIKRKYRERRLQRETQWPPVSVEKLVNLQLVEAEKKEGFRAGLPQHGDHDDKVKHTPVLHGDLFKVEEGKKPVRKLIVEGNAGIGKTTLCTMLTEEWANGKILEQFDCVLLLPLRERLVSTATTLPQLFKLLHSSESVVTAVMEELEEREGEGVLIIADGWDELDQKNQSNDSFLYRLLFGDLLPFASSLLTSRPSASAPLHDLPTVDRLVEVVGFNEENVKQYIKSEFEKSPEKASSLIKQLESNPLISSVCSVPLNCAIICNLWHTLDQVFPKTLTELYVQIILNVILRNLKKQGSYQDLQLVSISFDSIPENLCDMFWLTCRFAYECLSQDKIVFSKEEMTSLFPQLLDFTEIVLCFGLLQCARSLLSIGQGLSFHFVHLTIQEFLAALHLVTLPNEDKLKACQAHAKSDRFSMVWRFMFGLGCKKEEGYSRKVVCLDDEIVDHFLSSLEIGDDSDHQLLLCHCSMECSDNTTISDNIANRVRRKFDSYLGYIAHTPFDCLSLFHVLSHTLHCSYKGTIMLTSCGLDDQLLIKLTDILSSSSGGVQVTELLLYGNKLTGKKVSNLFHQARASFTRLERLDLSENKITDVVPLPSSCKNLDNLDLSNNPLGILGIQALEIAIQTSGLVNLKRLALSHTLIDNADANGKLLTTLLPSIATHCPHLEDLDLSNNNLGVPGACAVAEGYSLLVSKKDGFKLDLSDTNMSGEAVVSLSNILTNQPCDSLCKCELDLSENPFGIDGLSAIFKVVSNKSGSIAELTIREVDFTTLVYSESPKCNIQSTHAVNNLGLVQFSSGNILKHLDFSDSHLGESGVKSLETSIQTGGLLDLERLDLSHTLIDNANVNGKLLTTLLPSIATHCPHLKDLDLSRNNLGVPGACALAEVFLLFVSKKDKFKLNLSNTDMSGEAAVRFSRILTSRPYDSSCICELDLSENPIGIDGLSAILKVISSNSYPIAKLIIREVDFTVQVYSEFPSCNIWGIDTIDCKLDIVQFSSGNILKHLDFSDSHLGESGVKSLETSIQTGGLLDLERLDLSHTLIDNANVNGKLLTTLLPSIATHCPHLKDLDLSRNNLGVPGACALAEVFLLFVSKKDKFKLNLSNTDMSGEAAVRFSRILTSRPYDSSCICELDLSENPIGIDGLSAILKVISSNSYPIAKLIIREVDFTVQVYSEFPSCNIWGIDTIDCKLDIVQFSSGNNLKRLDLWKSHLGEPGVKSLETIYRQVV